MRSVLDLQENIKRETKIASPNFPLFTVIATWVFSASKKAKHKEAEVSKLFCRFRLKKCFPLVFFVSAWHVSSFIPDLYRGLSKEDEREREKDFFSSAC